MHQPLTRSQPFEHDGLKYNGVVLVIEFALVGNAARKGFKGRIAAWIHKPHLAVPPQSILR